MYEQESEFTGNFPPEYISPKEKEKPWYGLQYAKAMYGTSNRMGPQFFYDDSEFQSLIEVAQGRQSISNIEKLFGFFRDPYQQRDAEQLAYINVQVLNMAPKYINRAVAKMQKYTYDISADAVDQVSIDEKQAYASSIEAYYRTNQWLMEMGINAHEMYPELDVQKLPMFLDEMMYDATVNPKIKQEIWAEMALQLLHFINEFQQKLREVDWDIVVLGKGHLHFYEDENGVPRVERINSKYHIGSYVDNENFIDQEYAGFFDWISINQIRKEMLACGHTEQEIEVITARWSNAMPMSGNITQNFNRYDGLTYIPVLRFYFRSEDNRAFVKSKNSNYGFDQLVERAYNYTPEVVDPSEIKTFLKQNPDASAGEAEEMIRENKKKLFESGERKIIKNTYCSIYGGTWILDSDTVYNYGRKKLPRHNLVEARLPIITFAPNMKEGRVVSFCAQMIEPLFMINVAHNKVKEILAKEYVGIMEIDFAQLQKVAIGKGGTSWTPSQVYEFFEMTRKLIKLETPNQYDQNRSGQAITIHSNGLALADYFSTITMYINILEQMTATPITDSISLPDRLSATAAKQSAQTSDVDMEWLYNAHENMYLQGSHYLLLLLQETKRDKKKISGFVPALGKVNGGYFDVPDEIAYCDYGIRLTRRATEEQRAQFYVDVSIALEKEQISLADSVFLRDIDNIKQARQMMVIRHNLYQRQKQAEAKFNNDLAIQSNAAAAKTKTDGDIAKEREKGAVQKEVELLKGRIQMLLQDGEKKWDATLQNVENASKERIARQQGMDTLAKEYQRSAAERYKSDTKLQETVISSVQKADSDHKKLMAPKPKA